MSRPRKAIAPRPGGRLTVADGRHRTMLYCTDDAHELWGWWCRDCPKAHDPDLMKSGAERDMERHKAAELAKVAERKRAQEDSRAA